MIKRQLVQSVCEEVTQIPLNPNFKEDLEAFVLQMPIVRFIQLTFVTVKHGMVEISIPYRDELSFTAGSFQAGPIGMLMDIAACGAVGTTLPAGWAFSTIDFTTKIVAPATGERFLARGHVVSSGKTVSVGEADVFAVREGRETLCATGLVTTRNFEVTPSPTPPDALGT
ncbi:MAG: PaaI family thioesterase [Myxococcota bacterium]